MYITITSIELKNLFKFFGLAKYALDILKQLKKEQGFTAFRKTGIGKTHYTLTAWESEADLKRFARSGAHLTAMKASADLAASISTYTFQSDTIPNWKAAKVMLQEKGKKMNF
ncbi:MAG: DUF3291 domain-containing protein [Bacteroidota bacterium]